VFFRKPSVFNIDLMIIQLVNPRKSLNKAFLKQKPLRSEIELFKTNLIRLLDKIDEIEHEENQKNHIRDFLRDSFYKETNEIYLLAVKI